MKKALPPLLVTLIGLALCIIGIIGIVVTICIPYLLEMADIICSGRDVDPNRLRHAASNTLTPGAFAAAGVGIFGGCLFSLGCLLLLILGVASLTDQKPGRSI